MGKIGHQNGVTAAFNRLRDLDPKGTKLVKADGKWPSIDTLPDDLNKWGAWDKAERSLAMLVFDHDAAVPGPVDPPVDPPPVEPPPTFIVVAPRTYNKVPVAGGADARYCTTGLSRNSEGKLVDGSGATYDNDGRCINGVRSANTQVPGLRQANNMNGMSPCALYPPLTAWPGDPKKNTGSWQL